MSDTRRKQLGQYFTPAAVIDFVLAALHWLSLGGRGRDSRLVIDPACGDGGFLRKVIDRRLAEPHNVYGIEKDPDLHEAWRSAGLVYKGGPHLAVADGLLSDEVRGRSPGEGAFDWVIGNPPYAGEGLRSADRGTLSRIASRYELCQVRWPEHPPPVKELRRMPLEVLFLERFYRLCRVGGLIGIVLPVGIFANARWRFVREWLLPRITLHAVVALPRNTFSGGGITASTCVAIAVKGSAHTDHEALLASVDTIGMDGGANELEKVLKLWKDGRPIAECDTPWQLPEQ